MSVKFTIVLKALLAVLFLSCLADMPYGFYQFVRFVALFGFALLAYTAYTQKRSVEMIIYIGLAILFQPILKIALGRVIWNVVDVIVAISLVISFFSKPAKTTSL